MMTREQAKNHLAEWLDEKMWRCFGTIDREAISIAVEALSTEPNCKDCKKRNNTTFFMDFVDTVSREEYEEVKAYMDTLVDAFIEDGEELAESVKVVRCKDCRWYERPKAKIFENCCRNNYLIPMKPNDFCSYGEKIEK